MPYASAKPCRVQGCPELVRDGSGYCERHKKERQRRYDRQRGSAAKRGYDAKWRKARERFLRAHPLCAECQRAGILTPASVVDHIIPHQGDPDLFRDESNWQALCKRCHDRKTAKEDGRWGK